MTYRELAKLINEMTEDQKDCDLTVEIDSEFYPANIIITDNDILDAGHPAIIVYSSL